MNPSEKRLDRKTRVFFDVLLIWQYHNQGAFLSWDQLQAREPKLIDKLEGDNTSGTDQNKPGIKYDYYYGGGYKIEFNYFERDKGAILERARLVYGMELTATSEGVRLDNLDALLKELENKESPKYNENKEYLKSIINADPGGHLFYTPPPNEPRKKRAYTRRPRPIIYAWLLDPKDKAIKELEPIQDNPVTNAAKGRQGPRQCICGAYIKIDWTLCPTCLKYYGEDRKKWPPWLRKWVKINDAEIRKEKKHLELEYIDEINYFDAGGGHKVKPKNNRYESDREDLNEYRDAAPGPLNENQLYNELSASDKALIYPGEHPSAATGRSKYDKKELDQYSPQDQSAKIWSMQDPPIKATSASDEPNDYRNFGGIEKELDLYEAAEKLPDRERFIYQRHKTGYNQTETAAALGISQQMVSKIYRRTIKKLSKQSKK